MEKLVQTLHPQPGKRNRPMPAQQYNQVRKALLTILKTATPTYTELVGLVKAELGKTFTGNVDWHVMVVKLDLEARKLVARTASKPEKYVLK